MINRNSEFLLSLVTYIFQPSEPNKSKPSLMPRKQLNILWKLRNMGISVTYLSTIVFRNSIVISLFFVASERSLKQKLNNFTTSHLLARTDHLINNCQKIFWIFDEFSNHEIIQRSAIIDTTNV